MIPIALVTGFLGSGKTTFLERLASLGGNRRLAYIVNEFSALTVNGEKLSLPPDRLIATPDGNRYCRCLAMDFASALRAMARDHADDLDGVVIEVSGTSDPRSIERMLAETGLDRVYHISTILTVIDPGTFRLLTATMPSIRAQVEAADLAIVNKVDQFHEKSIAATEDELRRIHPAIEVRRARRCEVDVELFAPEPVAATASRTRGYDHMTLTPAADIDPSWLRDLLHAARDALYQLQGFFHVDGTTHYVDATREDITIRREARAGAVPQLVCTYPRNHRDRIRALARQIESGR